MNDRDLMDRFFESGYVITEPSKFYREVRTIGLERLLSELENNSNESTRSFNYQDFEQRFLDYLREIRNVVVNDENYNIVDSSVLSTFIDTLKELGDKYILSNKANEERLNINLDLTRTREELTSFNRELASMEEELAKLRSNHNNLRNELIELDNDATISPVDKTERTFQIMEEIPSLQTDIRLLNNRISNLREQIRNHVSLIENFEKSLTEVKEAQIPTIDNNFQKSLREDIQKISDLISDSSLSTNAKNEIRRLSNNFIAIESVPFANESSRENSINELYNRFGITRSGDYVSTIKVEQNVEEAKVQESTQTKEEIVNEPQEIKEETIEVKITPKNEEKVKIENKRIDDRLIDSIIDEFKNEKAPIDADFDEIWKNIKEDFNNKPIKIYNKPLVKNESKSAKMVIFTGKMHNVTVNPRAFEGLVINKEYEVDFEDEVNYRLKGFNTSYPKDAFVLAKTKVDVNSDVVEKTKENVKIVKIEEPKVKEKIEVKEEVKKPTLKLVFYHKADDVTELYKTNDNMKIGKVYEFDASYEDKEFLKLKNGNFYKKEYFVTIDEYKKLLEERKKKAKTVVTKENKSKFKVGEDVVYFDRANLTDEEKKKMIDTYFKNGIKKNHKYKIIKINEDGTLVLEGLKGSFPKEGFLTGKEYDDIKEIINKNFGNKKVDSHDLDAIAKKFKDNSKLVEYVGPTTERLQNGMLYAVEIVFGKGALLIDQFGNQMMIDNFNPTDFKQYKAKENTKALVAENVPINEEESSEIKEEPSIVEEELPEVILVEQLENLDKVSSTIFVSGLAGLAVTILANPIIGATALPMLLTSLGVSSLGVITKSKFAQSFYTSKMYNKVKKALDNVDATLKSNKDLSVDELTEIKGAMNSLNNSLNEIKKICEDNGLTSKIL